VQDVGGRHGDRPEGESPGPERIAAIVDEAILPAVGVRPPAD
jgi:hypothetical protein